MVRITILSILSIIISLTTIGCSSESDTMCFTFEQKQCGVDPWTENSDLNDLTTRISSYLGRQGINLKDVTITMSSEATCLACEVCSDGTIITVSIDPNDTSIVQGLDLLNLMAVDC